MLMKQARGVKEEIWLVPEVLINACGRGVCAGCMHFNEVCECECVSVCAGVCVIIILAL